MFLASEEEPPKSLSLRLSVVAAYMWKSCYAKLPSLSSKKMVEKLLAMHQLSSKLASFFHAFLIVPPLLKLSYQGGESWRILKNLHLTKKQIQVTNQKIRTTEDIFEFTKLKSASGRNRCFFSIPWRTASGSHLTRKKQSLNKSNHITPKPPHSVIGTPLSSSSLSSEEESWEAFHHSKDDTVQVSLETETIPWIFSHFPNHGTNFTNTGTRWGNQHEVEFKRLRHQELRMGALFPCSVEELG